MDVNERFIAIVDDIHKRMAMSQSEIERRCGMASVISNIRKGVVAPSLMTVAKLLRAFPEYSAEWMLLESGSMVKGRNDEAEALRKECDRLMRLNLKLQEELYGNK